MKQILFALFILIGLTTACDKKQVATISEELLPVRVHSVEVLPEDVLDTLSVLGEVEAQEHVAIYPKLRGKLASYAVQKGQPVQKGDLIAYIDRDEVGYQYHQAPVYSPLSGIVSAKPLDLGSEVRPDTVIGKIMNIETVKTVFSVPDRYLDQIRLGQRMDVSVGDALYVALVSEITPIIDPATRSFTVIAKIDNPQAQLHPGMFARAEIVLKTMKDSILVPEEAVIAMGGRWHVFKIVEGVALLEEVKLGLRKPGKVQILDGVKAQDHIITHGNHKVAEKQRVVSP